MPVSTSNQAVSRKQQESVPKRSCLAKNKNFDFEPYMEDWGKFDFCICVVISFWMERSCRSFSWDDRMTWHFVIGLCTDELWMDEVSFLKLHPLLAAIWRIQWSSVGPFWKGFGSICKGCIEFRPKIDVHWGPNMRVSIWAFTWRRTFPFGLDDDVGLLYGVPEWCGTLRLDIIWMSYRRMKFGFWNFIHPLPPLLESNDKDEDTFGKTLLESHFKYLHNGAICLG